MEIPKSDRSIVSELEQETEWKDPPSLDMPWDDNPPQGMEEAVIDQRNQPTSGSAEAEPQEEPEDPAEYEESAENMIMSLDVAQMFILPKIYRKKFFNDQEDMDLRSFLKRQKAAKRRGEELVPSEYEAELLDRWDEFRELEETIEFDEDEIEMLKTPLAKVLMKYKSKPGPEFMLFTAAMSVIGLRYIPLFSKSR